MLQNAKDLYASGGLSKLQVLKRQEANGLNILPSSKPRTTNDIVIEIIKEPMAYLLLGCGAVYYALGDHQEALMLTGFLLLIIAIEVIQERKTEKALEALKNLSSPRALVLRDGMKQRIPGSDVVEGDILFISEGDRVPADAVLFTEDRIAIDESLLTGESMPVEKTLDSKVYAGTNITRGKSIGLVYAIGLQTELGKIGKTIQSPQKEKTFLEIQTASLIKKLAWIAAFICIGVFIVFSLTRQDWLEGFLAGLTLAMAIMPNELPAVLAIFLALGAWRMSQRRVLTRRLPAIENLGSTTILCVDKTGTLTLNQMTIQMLFSNSQLLDLENISSATLSEDFHEILEFGILASRQDPYDPMELAFISAGIRFLKGTEHLHYDWELKREYPLSNQLLSISHAWKPSPAGGFVIGAKGAPEAILDLCHLSQDQLTKYSKTANEMAARGLRIIGVAKSKTNNMNLPDHQHDFDFEFLGFVGIADPIRPEVPAAIQECQSAGIRVVMITGDHPITATSIAKKIALSNPESVLTGKELESLSAEELLHSLTKVNVYSRVSPLQKLKLVEALKENREIVAMTGDGVNDAPALRNADVGIAMGLRGTDVARESAALVLLDDDFGSIVEAIRMGRRIYANLRSTFVYLVSTHIPIAGMSIIPVVFKMPLVLLPAHIALLHLIIEPASTIVFEVEPASSQTMKVPPRSRTAPLFDKNLLTRSFLKGIGVLIALLIVYFVALWRNQGEKDARALVFTTLIIANTILLFTNRGSHISLRDKFFELSNKSPYWISIGAMILLSGVLYIPYLRDLFHFSFLHLNDILICLITGIGSVLLTEKTLQLLKRV